MLTGEAAVTIGASGQGMVAGDLVNTASRLQSAAEPGAVLVGEGTFRATSGAIGYEPAGERSMKGKATPVPAWRATSVVARARGAGRSEILEPPFVGRDADFQALKERLHATSRDGRARLVSIVGVAGIGKSRLAWEFEKYLDGLVETVHWHHGRSPAYGDGLAFWALGEMVRRRAGVAETDDQTTTGAKLAACLADFVPDEEERRWVSPRLRALLGLEEAPPGPREELFAAWRTFFERVADRATAVLVFEDLQWADPGLIDFIESILEWSRSHRLLILTLARPELLERRPSWGAGQRDFLAMHLDPLPAAAMSELVNGLAPGLPAPIAARIVARAEGIPLYAVEMFRMLLDRGLVVREGDGYRPTAELADFEIPETLQALLAARLDGLPAAEHRLVQDAAVLGKSFTIESLAAIVEEPAATLEPHLRSLVRRELLTVDLDPRSPERGQYTFVGALVREVAYSTLSRRDRRVRHLAAARYFEALGDDELAGILASHYVDAHAASSEGPEAEAVAAQARIALRAAAERALSLGSAAQATTYLELALTVTTDPAEVARLHEEAGRAARMAGDYVRAERSAIRAVDEWKALGDASGVARASAVLGQVLLFQSRIDQAMAVLQGALDGLGEGGEGRLVVEIQAMLARGEMLGGHPGQALARCEAALATAARLDLVPAIGDLIVTRAWAVGVLGRFHEMVALLEGAIAMAREHGLVVVELRAINNLASILATPQPRRSLALLREGLALAERIGDGDALDKLAFAGWIALYTGEWAWGESLIQARYRDDLPTLSWGPLVGGTAELLAWRGKGAEANAWVERMRDRFAAAGTYQDEYALTATQSYVALAAGDLSVARRAAEAFIEAARANSDPAEGYGLLGCLAAWQGDMPGVRAALSGLAEVPAQVGLVRALRSLLQGALAARDERPKEAVTLYASAIEELRRDGNELMAMIANLEVVGALGPDHPAGAAAADEVRRFAEQVDSPAALRLLEMRLAAPRPWAPGGSSRAGVVASGAPVPGHAPSLQEADRPA